MVGIEIQDFLISSHIALSIQPCARTISYLQEEYASTYFNVTQITSLAKEGMLSVAFVCLSFCLFVVNITIKDMN